MVFLPIPISPHTPQQKKKKRERENPPPIFMEGNCWLLGPMDPCLLVLRPLCTLYLFFFFSFIFIVLSLKTESERQHVTDREWWRNSKVRSQKASQLPPHFLGSLALVDVMVTPIYEDTQAAPREACMGRNSGLLLTASTNLPAM